METCILVWTTKWLQIFSIVLAHVCMLVPLSQQNLVSMIALQSLKIQTWNLAGL